VAVQDLRVLFPREGPSPRPPAKPFLPGPLDHPVELPQAVEIRGPSIVLVVTAEFRVEGGLLPVHVVVAMGAAERQNVLRGLAARCSNTGFEAVRAGKHFEVKRLSELARQPEALAEKSSRT